MGDDANQYELQRQQRIARNRARMAELQLEELANDVQLDAQQLQHAKQAEQQALRQELLANVVPATQRPVRRASAAAQYRMTTEADDEDEEEGVHASDDEYDPLDELQTKPTAMGGHPSSSGDTSSLSLTETSEQEEDVEGGEDEVEKGGEDEVHNSVLGVSKLQQKQRMKQEQRLKQQQQQRMKQQQRKAMHTQQQEHENNNSNAAREVLVIPSDDDEELQRALLMSMQDVAGSPVNQPSPSHQHPTPKPPAPTPTNPSPTPKPQNPPQPRGKKRQRALSDDQVATVFAVLQRGGDMVGRSHIAYAAQQLELQLTEDELDVMIDRVQEHTGGERMLTYEAFCTLAQQLF